MKYLRVAAALVAISIPAMSFAETRMTNAQLVGLTGKGVTLTLGGEGQGYVGSLKLSKNGKGKGAAVTDAGEKIAFSGTWAIEGDQFCRTWTGLASAVEKVCEDWVLTSGQSVDVMVGGKKIGVNSW